MIRLAVILFTLICLLCAGIAHAWRPCNTHWYDEFAYGQPTRALNGNGGWSGTATTDIYAWDNWCCLMDGGTGSIDAIRSGLNYSGVGGIVWVHTDILGHNSNDTPMWKMWIDDESGRSHACLQGSCNWLEGVSGGTTTTRISLTDRQFHDIDIKINTVAHTADFYAQGVAIGQLSYANGQSATVDRVRLERIDSAASDGSWLLIGDIFIGEQDTSPPDTPGPPYRAAVWQPSTSITFRWPSVADACGQLAGYWVQVGTSPGAADIADTWVGNVMSYKFTGAAGTTYYCRVHARDNAGNQSAWSGTGSSETVKYPPVMQVDGKPFFPMGYYTSSCPSSVESVRNYLSTQHAQGMNSALSCYSIWGCGDAGMVYEMEGAALADMRVLMEVHRYAVRGDPGYPSSLIDSQVNLLKDYPNLIGWYLIDEPETQSILPSTLQARYAQIKALDPNHSIWVVHYAYPGMYPARPAQIYLPAEPPPYCDVLMTDTYPVYYGSPEFGGSLWMVASESLAHTDMSISYGKQAYANVPQVQGYQNFNTRLPTYPEQRYLAYAPVICGARSLFYWMYEAYSSPEHQENVVGPIAREISSLIPAIMSDSSTLCVSSNRDNDTTGHGVADVTYMFGEDARGGYVIASNNTANTLSVTFQLAGDILSQRLGSQSASVPVMFESRDVTAQYSGNPAERTLADTFSPYDVNVYRIYTINDRMSIDLGSPDVADGMGHPQPSDGDTVAVANMGGVNCKRNSDPGGSSPDGYFYFSVSDQFAYQGNRPDIYITVRYYDSGTGFLELQYDAVDSVHKSGGTIPLTATNTWKQHTFHVGDAYLGNRQSAGADFRISGGSGSTFYLDYVSVEPGIKVTSDKPNGVYRAGEQITVLVEFRTPVFVTGAPQLELETGAVDRLASYSSGSGTDTLAFTYTVQEGDNSTDLDCTGANALIMNGGAIKDEGGVDVDATLPLPGGLGSLGANKSIVIDTTAPTVSNVTSSKADGAYRTGAVISVQVTLTEPVYVTGPPRLEMETGAADRLAAYSGGSGTNTISFSYSVQNNDESPDLEVTSTNALLLNGGTIKDAAGNPAVLVLPQPGGVGSLSHNKNLVIDAVRPVVVDVASPKPDGVYKAGESIGVGVRFSEAVVVTGTPQIELETGTIDRKANYASGSGSDTLLFAYTVQAGDSSLDLDYKATNSLALNGGTVRDPVGNIATLTLPAPGAAGSLGFNKDIVLIVSDGSIWSAKQQPIGSAVTLGDKVLYLKRSGFGYIEEQNRTCGMRIEGTFDAAVDSLVCLRGVVRESSGGELYLDCDLVSAHGPGSVDPFGANNRFLGTRLMDGLYVAAWGRAMGDPVGNAVFISDGSDPLGIKAVFDAVPGVSAGDFVTVRGAAGWDGGRVIHAR